jgi:pimeloyl-ACP methyl ester carboxylesterase
MQVDIKFYLFAQGYLRLLQNAALTKERLLALTEMTLLICFSSAYMHENNLGQGIDASYIEDVLPPTEMGYRNQLHALKNFNSKTWVHEIKTPCLVIGSDEDFIVPLLELRELANKIPAALYYEFKKVGHMPHVEKPDLFCEQVLNFFNTH